MPELIPLKPKPSPPKRVRGRCFQCGHPLRRFVEVKADYSITEKAMLCLRCREWMERVFCFDSEEIRVIDPPKWSKPIGDYIAEALESRDDLRD